MNNPLKIMAGLYKDGFRQSSDSTCGPAFNLL